MFLVKYAGLILSEYKNLIVKISCMNRNVCDTTSIYRLKKLFST